MTVDVRERLDDICSAGRPFGRKACTCLMAVVMVGMTVVPGVVAQVSRSGAVPHYITGLKQVAPDAAAVYCAAVSTDGPGRREAEAINRLAREVFGEDADGVGVPLKNSDRFVAPRIGAGKRGQAAPFEIEYTGFSPEAKTAFQYAVDVWSALVESSVPIRIEASWTSLDDGVLGSAGPDILHGDFGFGEPDTWYPSSLANALAGADLSTESVDIVANFNSDFEAWYFGLDGNTPPGEIDFVTVVMHEIGHGLGFFGTMNVDDGTGSAECDGLQGNGCWGFESHPDMADIFERFAEDLNGNLLIDTNIYPNPSSELGDVLIGADVYFDGAAAVDAFGDRPPLYAPFMWNGGSSFSHLDEASFPPGDPSSLMTPSVSASEAIHDPGPVGCGIFADMGWTTTVDCGFGVIPETPSIPVPISPENDATDVPVDVTLSWEEAQQADAYSLEIARTASFATPEVSVSGIEETSYSVEGLQNDTEYYWHVRATNAQSTSAYSTTYRFVTTSAPPAAPALIAPEDGAGSLPTTVLLDWQAVENADEYVVEVDTTAEFAAPVFRLTVSEAAVELMGLGNERTYFWRVRGRSNGETGEWSNTWAFTTIVALPAPPQLATPEDGDTSVSVDVELVWNSAARADRYEVVVASDSTFKSIVADSALADTSFTAAPLENNVRYYWRVRGINSAGSGAWSAVFEFETMIAAPAVPRLKTPENAARDVPVEVTFTWQAAVGAAGYELEVSTTLNFEDPVLSVSDIDTTALTVEDLEHDTQYFWRVRAFNQAGRSVFTSPFTFFTRVAPPGGVPLPASPVSGATALDTSITLAWNAVTGADGYRVQVGTDSTFTDGLTVDSTVSGRSLAIDGLETETRYFWHVSAMNAGGQGPWSSTFDFTTQIAPPGAAPMQGTPPDDATDLDRSIQLEWDAVDSAERYELVVSRDSTFVETILARQDVQATSFTISELDYETTYFWRVRALNAGGEGPWSDVRRFTTKAEPSDVATDETGVPRRFLLAQNYPNPFNPSTTFRFALPTSEQVILEVMDVAGRTVAVVVDQRMPAGRHEVVWAATGLPSGTYVYRLRAGDFVRSRTFVLLK